jgi:hypothetical protein
VKLVSAVAKWNRDLLAADDEPTDRRGTRWHRSALLLVPSVALIAGIGEALAQGALAASFNLTNTPFTLMSNEVTGSGAGAVLNTPTVESSTGTTSNTTAMARVGFSTASLAGLCGIVTQSFAGVNYSLLLTAGQAITTPPPATITTDITAKDLFLEATDLKGGGATSLTNVVLGESADKVAVDSNNLGGAAGAFGLDATTGSVTLQGLTATSQDTELTGTLTLPGLHISVVSGTATHC